MQVTKSDTKKLSSLLQLAEPSALHLPPLTAKKYEIEKTDYPSFYLLTFCNS
jgi:hypothetical protein